MPVVDGAPAGVLCFEQHQMPQFCQYDGRRRMPKIMEAHSTSTAPHATVAGLFLGRVQSHDFAHLHQLLVPLARSRQAGNYSVPSSQEGCRGLLPHV